MLDMNIIIANNILAYLRRQNRRQIDLAVWIGTSKQTVNKMLNGSRQINAAELKQIASFLGVNMEQLVSIPAGNCDTDITHTFMGKVTSDEGRKTLQIADELSDMILFHRQVRENGTMMMISEDGANE